MGYTISSYVGSHVGLVRNTHEDNYLLNSENFLHEKAMRQLNGDNRNIYKENSVAANHNRMICTVADGMGGYQAGNVASLVAVQLLKQSQKTIIESKSIDLLIKNYQRFLSLLNQHILKMSKTNCFYEEMGSTLTSWLLLDNHAVLINLGDSPGYIFTPVAGLTKLTTAQNYGHTLLKRKEIKSTQLNDQPDYKHLTNFLGMESFDLGIEGNVSSIIELQDENLFLLCSDGVSDLLSEKDIETILNECYAQRSWETAVNRLIDSALEKGGTDNITAMVIAVNKN